MAFQLPSPSPYFDHSVARRKYFKILSVVFSFIFVSYIFFPRLGHPGPPPESPAWWGYYEDIHIDLDDLPPVIPDINHPGRVVASTGRLSDVSDSFENFTRYPWCTLSSLELHDPFAPLCQDMDSVMTAMSSGGRSGVDMPYRPRGCDFRWFDTAEICQILSKFSFIHIVGDSMMRNLAVAMHIFLRADLMDGGWLGWTVPSDGNVCSCSNPFDNSKCIFNAAFSSKLVWDNDPGSMACPKESTPFVEYNTQTTYPLGHDVDGLIAELPTTKPAKPHAFIIGHGVWNGLNETATEGFLEEIQTAVNTTMPWLTEDGAVNPRLFITPSASGDNKPVQYQETQGNVALRRFEINMGPRVKQWGFDHLGIFNMTLQNTTPDGTHAGMRSNLIKAMMVFNWLYHFDVSGY